MRIALLAVLLAIPAFATSQQQALLVHVPQQRLFIVARGDAKTIDAHDDRFGMKVWSAEGLAAPRLQAISNDGRLLAIADPVMNQAAIVSITERTSRLYSVAETPVALAFLGDRLYVLSRDGNSLTLIDHRRTESVATRRDSAFLATSGGRLYVYSRLEGAVDEYDPDRLIRTRTVEVPRFASDFEADERRGYLVYPRTGKMATFSLERMRIDEEFTVGAVPVDIALEGDPNLISAGTVSVADPSSKRIWRVERSQSSAEAFGRGFLRGLLGLGLYTLRSTEFPTGIDRLWSVSGKRFAYDSSSGTLYRVVRGRSRVIARIASPNAFALARDRVALWNEERQTLEFRNLGN